MSQESLSFIFDGVFYHLLCCLFQCPFYNSTFFFKIFIDEGPVTYSCTKFQHHTISVPPYIQPLLISLIDMLYHAKESCCIMYIRQIWKKGLKNMKL